MKYTAADLAALKSPDTMRAYAEARLDGRHTVNGFRCACPWGNHNDPRKVEITEYQGQGRATCWACGKHSANVFDLAAACSGIPNDKEHFAELVEHVAAVTGYHLTADEPHPRKNSKRKRRTATARTSGTAEAPPAAPPPQGGATDQAPPTKPATDVARPFVDEPARKLAMEAVERAARNPAKLAALAADLGLPAKALTTHADIECHPHGLIGLTPRGLLLFISTKQTPEEGLQVAAVKARAPKHGTAPAEVIEGGQWVERGTMDAARQGGKFRACTKGTGAALWGLDAVADHDTAIITEGESDKLAVDLSLDSFRQAWQADPEEYMPEHILPAVVACAGCNAFKPAWAPLFRGKTVIICGDNDPAGLQGQEHTARLMLAAGVDAVKRWTPREGYKDARQQYRDDHPAELIEDIILRSTSIQ